MDIHIVVTEYSIECEVYRRIEGVFSTEELAHQFILTMVEDENTIETYITMFELDKVY